MHRYRHALASIREAILKKQANAEFLGFVGEEPADGGDAILNFEC